MIVKGGIFTEKAIISLSFDDGRKDNFDYAAPLLKKYHIPATFNIVTAYIEKGVMEERWLPEPAMSVDEVKALAQVPGFEIASHSHIHDNSWDDIREGLAVLRSWIGAEKLLGFASPWSEMTEAFIRERQEGFRALGCLYVRVGYRMGNLHVLRVLARKAGHIFHVPWLYRFTYAPTLQACIENRTVFSVPILRNTQLQQVISLIELAKKRKQACTLQFHGILPEGKSCRNMRWAWKAEDFELLLKYLSVQRDEDGLELMTTAEFCRRFAMEKDV